MTILFYKEGIDQKSENWENPAWVFPSIWRLGRVRDTKFGTSVFNKMLLNAQKCQGSSLYRFWLIKGKPTGGGGKITPSHPD